MDDLTDSLLTEQFLMTLSPELRQHVYAREPTCAEDSAKFADVYFHSTRMGNEPANSHITRGGLQHRATEWKELATPRVFRVSIQCKASTLGAKSSAGHAGTRQATGNTVLSASGAPRSQVSGTARRTA